MRSYERFGLLAVSLASIASLAAASLVTPQKDKICWSECKGKLMRKIKTRAWEVGTYDYLQDGSNDVVSAAVEGCRRRRANPGFWCDGLAGPPCTMKRGDRVYLRLELDTDRVPVNVTQARNRVGGATLEFTNVDTVSRKAPIKFYL